MLTKSIFIYTYTRRCISIYGNESGMGDINTGAEDILHQGRKWFMRDVWGSDTSYGSGSVEGK